MGNAFITRRAGGGGGLSATDALLRVQAPAGSTVTITKGGTTKTDAGHENADDHTVYDYYFIIHASQFDGVNPWTVTATLGGESASDTVIIDSADEYDVELSFRVPSTYQEVEFLESTGSQYLVLPTTSDLIFSGSTKFLVVTNVNYSALFGSGPNSTSTTVSGSYGLIIGGAGTPSRRFQYSNHYNTNVSASSTGVEYTLSFSTESGSQSYTLNGTTYTDTQTGTISTLAPYLFAWNYNGGVKTGELPKVRVYNVTLYGAGGSKIIECVPCYRKADSVAGMWERVTETFLTNDGSGTFTVGSDV